MTEMKKVMLALGAVFSVALLLSVVVLTPFSVDSSSAEKELTEEEKQAYIDAKIAELTAYSNEQMLEEYGITFEEYATAVDFLAENPIVLTSDDDGNITADSLDSVEAGRCLWESDFNGNDFNIYIDSGTWSALVFFFSNDFVNLAVDDYTGKERNRVTEAENIYNVKNAEYKNAVAECQKAENDYKSAFAESQEAARQYGEAKSAYDAAVKKSQQADNEVAEITALVNSQQKYVDQMQIKLDALQAECEKKRSAVESSINEAIDIMADTFCNTAVSLAIADVAAEQEGIDADVQIDDIISELFDIITIGTYIEDEALLAACGLSIIVLNARFADKVIDKLYSMFRVSDLVTKNKILMLLTEKVDWHKLFKEIMVENIKTTVWDINSGAWGYLNYKSAGYHNDMNKAIDGLDAAKSKLSIKASGFKELSKGFMNDLSTCSKNAAEAVVKKADLISYKAKMNLKISIADQDRAELLKSEKKAIALLKDKESTEVIKVAKGAIRDAKSKIVPIAKQALDTSLESLKTAKQGLAVAKQVAKKTAAEAGKVACKAALRTALACFGAVSIIIDILLALVMKFIMDHLSVNEPANGIEISVKVQDSFCIWGCRIWYPVFPSLNYIRAQ